MPFFLFNRLRVRTQPWSELVYGAAGLGESASRDAGAQKPSRTNTGFVPGSAPLTHSGRRRRMLDLPGCGRSRHSGSRHAIEAAPAVLRSLGLFPRNRVLTHTLRTLIMPVNGPHWRRMCEPTPPAACARPPLFHCAPTSGEDRSHLIGFLTLTRVSLKNTPP